jgi:hypothetical protein
VRRRSQSLSRCVGAVGGFFSRFLLRTHSCRISVTSVEQLFGPHGTQPCIRWQRLSIFSSYALGASAGAYQSASSNGLVSALAILTLLAIVALFFAQRIPTSQQVAPGISSLDQSDPEPAALS